MKRADLLRLVGLAPVAALAGRALPTMPAVTEAEPMVLRTGIAGAATLGKIETLNNTISVTPAVIAGEFPASLDAAWIEQRLDEILP